MSESNLEDWKKGRAKGQNKSLPPNFGPKYFPDKKVVSILAVIQLMLASSHFIENTILLHRNFYDFYDGESRLMVTIIWALTLCWILCTLILLIGLFSNLPSLLLLHIVFSIFWLLCKIIILLIMLISKANPLPFILVFSICVITIISLPYEWNCYHLMRALL
ncbi:putative integral membrane protein [Acanthocheilonema viteae]